MAKIGLAWLACLCLTAVVPHPLGAQGASDEAGTTVLFQINRGSHPEPIISTGPLVTLALPELAHANLKIDTIQLLPNVGILRGTFDLSSSGGPMTPSKGFIGLSEMAAGDWRLDLGAGDQPLDVYALDLGLNALYRPFVGVRGGSVTVQKGDHAFGMFVGRTTILDGFFAESVLVSEQSVVGARGSFTPLPNLRLAIAALRTFGHDPNDAVTPRGSTSVSGGLTYDLSSHITLVGESTVATASPNVRTSGAGRREVSSVIGTRFTGVRGSAELSLLRLAPSYLPYAQTRLGDRVGFFGRGSYRLGRRVLTDGAMHRWHNQGGTSSPASRRLDVEHQFLGARLSATPHTSVGARFGTSGVSSTAPDPSFADSRSRNLTVDVSQQLGGWRLVGRFHDISTSSLRGASQQSERRRVDAEVRRRWPGGASAWVTLGVIREHQVDARHSRAGTVGVSLPLPPSLTLFTEAAWNQELAGLTAVSVDNVSLSSSLSWTLPRGLLLSATGGYRRDSSVLDGLTFGPSDLPALEAFLRSRVSDSYQFTLRLEKRFGWGRSIRRLAMGDLSLGPLVEYGSVRGVVFNDRDGDGVHDEDEPGVRGVGVRFDGQRIVPVGPDGQFDLGPVPVGPHTVELELVTVPASYDLGPKPSVVVVVARNAAADVRFSLIEVGQIRGTVQIVEPSDGSPRPRPHRGTRAQVAVRLESADGRQRFTITDADGDFEFTSVQSGQYRVFVENKSLPGHWSVATDLPQIATVPPGGRVEGLSFVVVANPRPVRRIDLGPAR